MTLKEFDQIRPFLPEGTEVTISTGIGPGQSIPCVGEDWAIEIATWGNHDGRFNVHCQNCGWYSEDIPARLRGDTEKAYLKKPCPKCGAKFYKTHKEEQK